MIEILNGIHETVNFKEDTNLRLFNNDEAENYPKHWHAPLEIIMPTLNSYWADCSNISYDNTKAQRISTFRWKFTNTK